MAVIAVANHKGGVGKTATVHALGTVLADEGLRVLLVDIDPQASLTQSCGINAEGQSLAEVLGGATPGTLRLSDVIQELEERLAIAPADIALAATELGLTARLGREAVLKRALEEVATKYDVILIDCPPSLSLLTVNALTSADGVLIPTQPTIQDLRALRLFLDSVERVRENLNPSLKVIGILVTFCDRRLVHHRDALEVMRRAGLPLLGVQIGRTVRVQEAAAEGRSVVRYEPRNPQAQAYRDLGREVIQWLGNDNATR